MTPLRSLVTVLAVAALSLSPAGAQEPTLGWSDIHDGGAGLLDDGAKVIISAAGDPIVGGVRTDPDGPADILVRRFDHADGSILWSYVYVDPAGNDMELVDLVLDHRGDVLLAGYLSACDT